MRHLDLFSGIGGFALAAEWAFPDHEVVSFVEIDKFCQKVLNKHWPTVPIHDDIKTFNATKYTEIDLLTGGFPCQPFSAAGRRKGSDDNRYLWPEMLRVIREARPRWIVGENVSGIVSMALDTVCTDLEKEGYEVEPILIPACGVGAPHKRERVWIIGRDMVDSDGPGRQTLRVRSVRPEEGLAVSGGCSESVGDSTRELPHRSRSLRHWGDESTDSGQPNPLTEFDEEGREIERNFRGVPNGIPRRLDRLRSLGNSIVPQVAYQILNAINSIDAQ